MKRITTHSIANSTTWTNKTHKLNKQTMGHSLLPSDTEQNYMAKTGVHMKRSKQAINKHTNVSRVHCREDGKKLGTTVMT